jgi:hypothetical protein
LEPSKAAVVPAAALETLAAAAGTQVIAAELLRQLLGAADDPHAALHLRL